MRMPPNPYVVPARAVDPVDEASMRGGMRMPPNLEVDDRLAAGTASMCFNEGRHAHAAELVGVGGCSRTQITTASMRGGMRMPPNGHGWQGEQPSTS